MHIKLRLRALGGFVADGYIESSTRGSGREAAGWRDVADDVSVTSKRKSSKDNAEEDVSCSPLIARPVM
jgi:hypothetical protein